MFDLLGNQENQGMFLTDENGIEFEEFLNRITPKLTEEEKYLMMLRERRERECFNVVNRGSVWYDLLTSTQKQELREWYQAWLNVTETREPPEPLSWLKG